MKYKNILKPGMIGNLEIKNRLIVPPMLSEYAQENGDLTERYIAYYEEKAKGGFGLIITEDNAVERRGAGFTKLPGLYEDSNMELHQEFTSRIKQHGAKIFTQVYHAGREASEQIIGCQPVAPSAIHDPAIYEVPHELTTMEVKEMEDKFAQSIKRAQDAGYDGVEIHGAHGYLINQFVSPFSNKRTDEYGGNLENRLRFVRNIIAKSRALTGEEFVMTYRISADEFVEGGLTIEDTKVIAMLLEQEGIAAIHVSGAVYKSGHLPSAPYQAPTLPFIHLAKAIKEVVNIPVIGVNKINTPLLAESVLMQNMADFVAIGRASIADPMFVEKLMNNQEEDIIPCISCDQGCQGYIGQQKPVSCLVNARTGREGEYDMTPVNQEEAKKVMVIGGGIAGMQAAVVAATKGHDVTIYERESKLGGQWLLAAIPPGKEIFNSFIVYLKTQITKLNIEVKLNTDVTEAVINEFKPDHIILSAGANPVTVPFKGIETNDVVQANDLLAGEVHPGRNIAVIGGGLVGAETAEHLAVHGAKVSIIEMNPTILDLMPDMPKKFMVDSFKHNDVDVFVSSKLEEIKADRVVYSNTNAFTGELETKEVLVDQVVMAIGSRPNTELQEFINANYNYAVIGDANNVADGINAIKTAYEAALNI